MKKTKISIVLFFMIGTIIAQTHYQGQYSLSMQGGASKNGWYANTNLQKLIGSKSFLGRVDLSYLEQKINLNVFDEREDRVNYNNYTLGISGGYSIEKFHPIYIQGFVGPFLGMENFNSRREVIKGIPYEDPSGFIYGIYGGGEIEFSLIPNFSLIAVYQQYYRITSELGKTFYQVGGGMKFNF